MNFALFRCCPTSAFLKQYETSTDAVLKKLDVSFVDIPEFGCCGYPLKNYDFKSYILSSARNLCLAERQGLNIITLCNCCYGTLAHVDHLMKEDASLRGEINGILRKEGLEYGGNVEVRHVLDVFYRDIGIDRIKQKITKKFNSPKIAAHNGCHLLRPREIVRFDDPEEPSILDQLVELTGAESVVWQTRLQCCGAPSWGINDDLSMDLTENKVNDARQSGAEFLCVSCVYCQLQFDRVQKILCKRRNRDDHLPSILYVQLLGLSLGIDEETLGIDQNELDIRGILGFLS